MRLLWVIQVCQYNHKGTYKRKWENQSDVVWKRFGLILLALKMEEKGHEPTNIGKL